jgi:Spy/CpxP family protein refolding chaperone
MKNRHLFQLFLLIFSIIASAQDGQRVREKRNEVKALKIAFITEELALTTDEATKFWPIFNAFENKQQEIRKQKLKGYLNKMDSNTIDKLSDKEATNLLVKMENAEDEIHQNKKNLTKSLQNIISPIKILKLKKAEQDFNKKVLKQLRNKRLKK